MNLVFGDPNEFAICALVVPEWSTSNFPNGLLFYMVKGHLLGTDIKHSTLNTNLNLDSECKSIAAQICDTSLAATPTMAAYLELSARTWALGRDHNDYSYNVATYCQSDVQEMVYLVKTPFGYDRLIWGNGYGYDCDGNARDDVNNVTECQLPEGLVLKTMQLASAYKW